MIVHCVPLELPEVVLLRAVERALRLVVDVGDVLEVDAAADEPVGLDGARSARRLLAICG